MQVKAVTKYVRISAFKAREVTREIQGKPVAHALDLLAFTPKKAATLINKTLRSAVANAENNNGANVDSLTVMEAVVGEGPTIKRWRARARGGASPILKRTSHISITLTDELPLPEPKKRGDSSKRRRKTRPAVRPAGTAREPSADATPAPAGAAPPADATAHDTPPVADDPAATATTKEKE